MRQGRRRGAELRRAHRPEELERPPVAGWLLRHPADHYFRRARITLTDPPLCAPIDAWIAAFAPSYTALAGQDWSAEHTRADLVAEIQLLQPVPDDWNEPVVAAVLATHRGSAPDGATIALRQVADPDAVFNGRCIDLLSGEGWLIWAHVCNDGTFVPGDGTRRINAPDLT